MASEVSVGMDAKSFWENIKVYFGELPDFREDAIDKEYKKPQRLLKQKYKLDILTV